MRNSAFIILISFTVMGLPPAFGAASYELQNLRRAYEKLSQDPSASTKKLERLREAIRSYESSERLSPEERMQFHAPAPASGVALSIRRAQSASAEVLDPDGRAVAPLAYRDLKPTAASLPPQLFELSVDQLENEIRRISGDQPNEMTLVGMGKKPLSAEQFEATQLLRETQAVKQNAEKLGRLRPGDSVAILQRFYKSSSRLQSEHLVSGQILSIQQNVVLILDKVTGSSVWLELNLLGQTSGSKLDFIQSQIYRQVPQGLENSEIRAGAEIAYVDVKDQNLLHAVGLGRAQGEVLEVYEGGQILVRDLKTQKVSLVWPQSRGDISLRKSAPAAGSCRLAF